MCRDPVFIPRQYFYWFLLQHCFCIFSIHVLTRKVYRDKVLSLLNLISYCNFILILRPSLLVLWLFLSQLNSYVATKLFAFNSCLCRDSVLLCRDKTSLPCVGIFIAAWKSLSRPCLSVLSLFLCRNLKIPIATPKPLFSLEVCRNIELFCCNQVSSLSQHYLSQLCFSVRTRNLVF